MIKVEKTQVGEELSLFIAYANNQKQFHVGYCGNSENEILHMLYTVK